MKSRQSLTNSIMEDLSELGDAHSSVYQNVMSCINTIRKMQAENIDFNSAKIETDDILYLQEMALEQAIAKALLNLYKKPIPPQKGLGLFSQHTKEAERIKNKIEEIVKNYFLKVEDNRKLKPEEITSALIEKVKSTQHLIHLLNSPQEQRTAVVEGLKDITFWQTASDFGNEKELWHEYHKQLQNHPALKRGHANSFVIKECFMEAVRIQDAVEHHFTAPKAPVPLDSIIMPVAGLLAIGLAGTGNTIMPPGEGAKIFTHALDQALLMKKNNENTLWETNVPLPKDHVQAVHYPDKENDVMLNKASFEPALEDVFNETIMSGYKRSAAMWKVYFIELDDESNQVQDKLDNTTKVFVFSLEQAKKFVNFLKEHPLWFDQKEGWRLSEYKDFIPFKEIVINKMCDVLDDLNQSFDAATKAAIREELAEFRRQASKDMPNILAAFAKTKAYCEELIHLNQKPGKHPMEKCFLKVEAELFWMQEMQKNMRKSRQQPHSEVLQDQAIIAVRDFTPGLLVKRIGDQQISKHTIETAYVDCLQDYMNGKPKNAAAFQAIQEEYEFLSNPLHLKAFSDQVEKSREVQMKGETELGELRSSGKKF